MDLDILSDFPPTERTGPVIGRAGSLRYLLPPVNSLASDIFFHNLVTIQSQNSNLQTHDFGSSTLDFLSLHPRAKEVNDVPAPLQPPHESVPTTSMSRNRPLQ